VEERSYFIKSGDREKGPYTAEKLRASFRDGVLQRGALVRADGESEWMRLDEAVKLDVGAPGRRSSGASSAAVEAEANASAMREQKQRDVVIGALICLAGVVITFVSYSSASGGGGRYVVAWGAIVFGAIRMFRGYAGGGPNASP
jgi:hypothetical protein